MVGIPLDRFPGIVLQVLEEHSIPWKQIWNPSEAAICAQQRGLTGIPASLMLDAERNIVEVNLRTRSSNSSRELESWLESRLAD